MGMMPRLLPRRHRSLIYKAVVVIPLLWISWTVLMNSSDEEGGGNQVQDDPGKAAQPGGEDQQQQQPQDLGNMGAAMPADVMIVPKESEPERILEKPREDRA